MEHVVTQPPESFCIADGRIEVFALPAWQDNIIWLMYDRVDLGVVIIDGPCAEPFDAWMKQRTVSSVQIWNTHFHPDHVGINREILERKDLKSLRIMGSAVHENRIPGMTVGLHEGQELTFADETFEVWRTDGHVDGHLCFVHPEVLFCGDTLFSGGCGYLFDGPFEAMFESLNRLARLNPEVRVCCAHEYTQDNFEFARFVYPDDVAISAEYARILKVRDEGKTTLPSKMGTEQKANIFLRRNDSVLAAHVCRLANADYTNEDATVFRLLRELKNRKVHRSNH